MVGTEMLIAATIVPAWSQTGAATQATSGLDSQYSLASPRSRTSASIRLRRATEVTLFGVIAASGRSPG